MATNLVDSFPTTRPMPPAQTTTDRLLEAQSRAAAMRPLRVRDGVGRVDADRITTLQQWAAGSRKAAALADHAYRHLLLPTVDDPDHYLARPLFGQARPLGAEQYLCETQEGAVVLAADTLVYWH